MGFQKPDISQAQFILGRAMLEISSPHNDGWTSASVKKELYDLKCWLDSAYQGLPTFVGEEEWEKEQVIRILQK